MSQKVSLQGLLSRYGEAGRQAVLPAAGVRWSGALRGPGLIKVTGGA